jgi:hypothetical protein
MVKLNCFLSEVGGDAIVVWQVTALCPVTTRPTRTGVFASLTGNVRAYVHSLFVDLGPSPLLQVISRKPHDVVVESDSVGLIAFYQIPRTDCTRFNEQPKLAALCPAVYWESTWFQRFSCEGAHSA